MSVIRVFALVALLIAKSLAGKADSGPVTCGSVVKLQHKETVRINAVLFVML